MPLPMNLDGQASLRWIFACHFALTVLVLMAFWPGMSYLFYNSFLLALLMWAEIAPAADSETQLSKCMLIEAASVIFDILVMATRYQAIHGVETFALVMAVVHLLGRFPSCYLLFQIREGRRSAQYGDAGGSSAVGGGGGAFGGVQSSPPGGYEEFPPSYGAGGPTGGAAGYTSHDTKPLAP